MSKKTLPSQLLEYLQIQKDFVAGAALSRLEWPKYTKAGKVGFHSPRSVIRRLEEMVEDGDLMVEYRHGLAYYTAQKKAVYPKYVYTEFNGSPTKIEIKNEEEERAYRTLEAKRETREVAEASSH